MRWGFFLIALLALLATASVARATSGVQGIPLPKRLEELPLGIGDYRGTSLPSEEETRTLLDAQSLVLRLYRRADGSAVEVLIGYYPRDRLATSQAFPEPCLAGHCWRSEPKGPKVIAPRGTARTIVANQYTVRRGQTEWVGMYWVESVGRIIPPKWPKLSRAWDALWRRRTDGVIVRVSAPFEGSWDEALERQVDFLAEILPLLSTYLPK